MALDVACSYYNNRVHTYEGAGGARRAVELLGVHPGPLLLRRPLYAPAHSELPVSASQEDIR